MGQSWESYVIESVLRSLQILPGAPQPSFYRTHAGAEVDLILEDGARVLPIEIKYTQHVSAKHIQSLRAFMQEYHCPQGLVLCNCERPTLLDSDILALPVNHL